MSQEKSQKDDHDDLIEALCMVSGRGVRFCDVCGTRILENELCNTLWIKWSVDQSAVRKGGSSVFGYMLCRASVCLNAAEQKFHAINDGELRRVLQVGRQKLSVSAVTRTIACDPDSKRTEKNIDQRILELESHRSVSLKTKSGGWRWHRGR